MDSSLIRSMFSRLGTANVLAEEMDSSLEGSSSGNANAPIAGSEMVDGSGTEMELEDLTPDLLLDEQLPAHSTAMVALSSLISRIDEVMDMLLCGEATFQGFELLQQDYLNDEERLVGSEFTNVSQH